MGVRSDAVVQGVPEGQDDKDDHDGGDKDDGKDGGKDDDRIKVGILS